MTRRQIGYSTARGLINAALVIGGGLAQTAYWPAAIPVITLAVCFGSWQANACRAGITAPPASPPAPPTDKDER